MDTTKTWRVKVQDEELVKELASALGIKNLTARLLINRGYTNISAARAFLEKSDSNLYDPFLMKDMDKAVARIKRAIDCGEHITIYGDYDVDGMTSVTLLYMYLEENGAVVDYFIPSRDTEGYGLGKDAVDRLYEGGTSLIITVDNGIVAVDETEYINFLGMDIVITDHHSCLTELPNAVAVVDPHRSDCSYPFKELAGVGVAFKVACALEHALCGKEAYDIDIIKRMCLKYIDIVTIGTIADVMPLTDENRIMVYMGLSLLPRTANIGLTALFAAAGIDMTKKITSSVIGYNIAPRINAVGRISKAERAVKLLLTDSPDEAASLAEEFCAVNEERQRIENSIVQDAIRRAEDNHYRRDSVIVIEADMWHHGVIGIAASKISEKYSKPCVLISFDGSDPKEPSDEDIGRGSARSIAGFNIAEAFAACAPLLEKYGGHELAAGLSIKRENLVQFREKINAYAAAVFQKQKPELAIDIDAQIEVFDANAENADDLLLLEPYGTANPTPVFLLEKVKIEDIVTLSMGRHTKMLVSSGGNRVAALLFGADLTVEGFRRGDIVNIAGNLNINEFRGERTPQIICRDISLIEAYHDEITDGEKYFQNVLAGDTLINAEDIPTHEDFGIVYKFLRRSFPYGGGTVSLKRAGDICELPYIKILCAFHVFYEAGLITYTKIPDYNYRIKLLPAEGKSDLSKTDLMKKILYFNSKTKFK